MGAKFKVALVAAVTVFSLSGVQGVAKSTHQPAQPALNLALMDYTPIGYYGPPDEAGTPSLGESAQIPATTGAYPLPPPFIDNPNPTGKWVPYDTNVWESLSIPMRHPGDNCNSLAVADQHPDCRDGDKDSDLATDPNSSRSGTTGPDGTSTVYGLCPGADDEWPSGECFNNQLEYLDHYEASMKALLADFGVTVKRYGFISPGVGRGGIPAGSPGASGGQAYNIAAVVPGADHPEQTVLVSGHYDFTDTGPTAAWDSAEGHTEVMRMAYLMADYWRKTGTRPSVTVKFIPWDSEESGTHGSADYVRNNIPPGEEDKVRGYFNVDPCAGAYPAYKETTNTRVPEVLQLANPNNFPPGSAERARIQAFNTKALSVVDGVFDRLDDRLTRPGGVEEPIFVSNAEATAGGDDKGSFLPGTQSQRGMVVTAVGGLKLFSSDYRNFEAVGIPIFNLFPDYFGPHADNTPASSEGVAILHTQQDNLTRINRLTGGLTSPANAFDATGTFASEGWAKGMEFCAQTQASYMLQPEMAGTQTGNTNPVAYFEALPNEVERNTDVTFNASGSYQYAQNPDAEADPDTPLQPDSSLTYTWNFGDGSPAQTGKILTHQYTAIGQYNATLTVTGVGGLTDTMTIPITVVGPNFAGPVLQAISPSDAADGYFGLNWSFNGPQEGFSHYSVEQSTDFQTFFTDDAETAPGSAESQWNVGTPDDPRVKPWQSSDSSTQKLRGNQMHAGARSYWTGVSPPDFNPSPVSDSSILTLKEPISVPVTGDQQLELSYWSLFQSEGDDQGRVEVGLVDGDMGPHKWQAVDVIQAVNTSVGGNDPAVCDPSSQSTFERGLVNRKINLAGFKGKQILLRFHYRLGAEDRAASQPCGWYIDDIRVNGGSFTEIGQTAEGNFNQTTFQVSCRPNGSYAYRVLGVYSDGVSTRGSNVELAEVTNAPPDLSPVKITTSTAPRRGRRTTLASNIKNLACGDATNVVVRFLDNGQQIGTNKIIALIAAGKGRSATTFWTPRTTGPHTIQVVVDPGGLITEPNEGNNNFSRTYQVRP